MLAGGCLILSSSVENGDQTFWPFHVLFASSFFVLTLCAILLTTRELHLLSENGNPHINGKLLQIRVILCYVGVANAVFAVVGQYILPHRSWVGPLAEWLGTFLVIGYISLFHFDWKKENIDVQLTEFESSTNQHYFSQPLNLQHPQQQQQQQQQQLQQQEYVQYVYLEKSAPVPIEM